MTEKTVANSMRRQGLVARRIRRRNGLTRQDRTASKFPDLLRRDFTSDRPMSSSPTVGSASSWLAHLLNLGVETVQGISVA